MQVAYQQLGKKKKSGIMPDIVGFDEQGRLVKKIETIIRPQYVVEPPYIEGNFEG